MTRLGLAAWCLVIALLGAELGLAAFRPWDHHVPLSLSGSHAAAFGRPSGSSSTGGASCPNVAVHRTEQRQAFPRNAWVHASDGLNLRGAPSASAALLATLATGTLLTLDAQQMQPDGSNWYHGRLGDGRVGWLRAGFTTNYPIALASTGSFNIWLPAGYQFQSTAPEKAEARYKNEPLALLYLDGGTRQQAPAELAVPAALPRPSTWTVHSTEQVLVGDLPATDRVFGIRLAGSGCPALLHEVRVTTSSHYYDLIFVLDEPSSSVVAQLLDSARLQ